MKIQLSKGTEHREVKAGAALYMLTGFIPMIGAILELILTIINKQFKGIILNTWICIVPFILLEYVVVMISAMMESGVLMFVWMVAYFAFMIYLYVHLILNANKYSLAQYLEDGYTIDNLEELSEEEKAWIEENKNIKRPFFLIFKF